MSCESVHNVGVIYTTSRHKKTAQQNYTFQVLFVDVLSGL